TTAFELFTCLEFSRVLFRSDVDRVGARLAEDHGREPERGAPDRDLVRDFEPLEVDEGRDEQAAGEREEERGGDRDVGERLVAPRSAERRGGGAGREPRGSSG